MWKPNNPAVPFRLAITLASALLAGPATAQVERVVVKVEQARCFS